MQNATYAARDNRTMTDTMPPRPLQARGPAITAKSVAALALAGALSLAGCPAAHAARATVSPGDEIRAVGATSVALCTLGYT